MVILLNPFYIPNAIPFISFPYTFSLLIASFILFLFAIKKGKVRENNERKVKDSKGYNEGISITIILLPLALDNKSLNTLPSIS